MASNSDDSAAGASLDASIVKNNLTLTFTVGVFHHIMFANKLDTYLLGLALSQELRMQDVIDQGCSSYNQTCNGSNSRQS